MVHCYFLVIVEVQVEVAQVEYRPFSSAEPEASVDFANTAALRPALRATQ